MVHQGGRRHSNRHERALVDKGHFDGNGAPCPPCHLQGCTAFRVFSGLGVVHQANVQLPLSCSAWIGLLGCASGLLQMRPVSRECRQTRPTRRSLLPLPAIRSTLRCRRVDCLPCTPLKRPRTLHVNPPRTQKKLRGSEEAQRREDQAPT